MELFANLVGAWVLCLGIAVLFSRGRQFANWSWGVISWPFRRFWATYYSQLLFFLLGLAVGVVYGPQILQLIGS